MSDEERFAIERAQQTEKVKVNPDEIIDCSAVMALEVATGIQIGKIQPVGYEKAADIFGANYRRTTGAQCAWLMIEAELAGRTADMLRKFPEVPKRANLAIEHMKQSSPEVIVGIINRLSQPDYNLRGI